MSHHKQNFQSPSASFTQSSADTLWPVPTEEKSKRVKAEGDYSINTAALSKKYRQVLMGRGPEDGVERKEILVDPTIDQEYNLNDAQLEAANKLRVKLMQKAKSEAKTAMKMDGNADLDLEGYVNSTSDSQHFRVEDGLNTHRTLLPPRSNNSNVRQNDKALKRHTVPETETRGGVKPEVVKQKIERPRSNAPAQPIFQHSKKSNFDVVQKTLQKRDDLTLEIGKLFLKIAGVEMKSIKSEVDQEGIRRVGQVLILREMELVKPDFENKEARFVEDSNRQEIELLAAHLGKMFVDIGLTLPSGLNVNESKKNDVIAYNVGSKAIHNADGFVSSGAMSNLTMEESKRNDLLSIAIGRILLHLRGASQDVSAKMASPNVVLKDTSSILALGRLTLQMIEQSASATQKSFYESRKHGEEFIKRLGLAVMLSAKSANPLVEESKGTEHLLKNSNGAVLTDTSAKLQTQVFENNKRAESLSVQKKSISLSTSNEPVILKKKQPVFETAVNDNDLRLKQGTHNIETLPSVRRAQETRTRIATAMTTIRERETLQPPHLMKLKPQVEQKAERQVHIDEEIVLPVKMSKRTKIEESFLMPSNIDPAEDLKSIEKTKTDLYALSLGSLGKRINKTNFIETHVKETEPQKPFKESKSVWKHKSVNFDVHD